MEITTFALNSICQWRRLFPLVVCILLMLCDNSSAQTEKPPHYITLLGPVFYRTTQVPVFTLPPKFDFLPESKLNSLAETDEEKIKAPKPLVIAENPRDEAKPLVVADIPREEKKGRRVKPEVQISVVIAEEPRVEEGRRKNTKGRKGGRKNRKKFSRRLLTTTEDPTSAFSDIEEEISDLSDVQPVQEDKSHEHHGGEIKKERIDSGLWDLPIVKLMSQKLKSEEKLLTEFESESTFRTSEVDNDIGSETIERMCASMRKATSQFETWTRDICRSMRDIPVAVQMATLLSMGIGSMILAILGLIVYRKYSGSKDGYTKQKHYETSKYLPEV